MKEKLFLDLFAGAGGLAEGFIKAGFKPVSHVEVDEAACFTLKTRQVYYWLKENKLMNIYYEYLEGSINRKELYENVPDDTVNSVINKEINDENLDGIFKKIDENLNGNKLDIIVGGPPCQAYSLAGRSRDKNKMLGDPRNYLYIYYAKFLEKYKPEYFVFENVLGLLSAKDETGELYLKKMFNLFGKIGYGVDYKLLDASDYGVLQKRKRVIIIGKLNDFKFKFPELRKESINITVNELLNDLPKIKSSEGNLFSTEYVSKGSEYLYKIGIRNKNNNYNKVTLHKARFNNDRDLTIYKIAVNLWNSGNKRLDYSDLPVELRTHKNTNSFIDRYKVVEGDWIASHTVVAHISKDGHYYIHPDIEQNRSLTVREAARLQSFPDDYFFESVSGKISATSAYKQIGNAVPVYLAKKIANTILEEYYE